MAARVPLGNERVEIGFKSGLHAGNIDTEVRIYLDGTQLVRDGSSSWPFRPSALTIARERLRLAATFPELTPDVEAILADGLLLATPNTHSMPDANDWLCLFDHGRREAGTWRPAHWRWRGESCLAACSHGFTRIRERRSRGADFAR